MSAVVFSPQEEGDFVEVRSCQRWLDIKFNHHPKAEPAHFCIGLDYGERWKVHEGHAVGSVKRGLLLFEQPRYLRTGDPAVTVWIALGFEFEARGHQKAAVKEIPFCLQVSAPCSPECEAVAISALGDIRALLVGALLSHDHEGRHAVIAASRLDNPFEHAAFLVSTARDMYYRHKR